MASQVSKWNRVPCIDERGYLRYSQYWDSGSMLTLREALSMDHPEHLYNYILRAGIRPEDYGIKHPVSQSAMDEYGSMSREELIQVCHNQRKELEAMYRAGF